MRKFPFGNAIAAVKDTAATLAKWAKFEAIIPVENSLVFVARWRQHKPHGRRTIVVNFEMTRNFVFLIHCDAFSLV